MLNRGQCVSRVDLLDAVWNLEPAQTTNIVDVYVNYLRRKLKDPSPGHLIRTVRGQGYVVPSEAELAIALTPAIASPMTNLPNQTPLGGQTQMGISASLTTTFEA